MEQAKRYNSGKVPLSLVDPLFIEQVAKIAEFGADKYGRDNWLKGQSWLQVLDSMKRHIAKFEQGYAVDEESHLPHLAHAACNLMFLIRYTHSQLGVDDRIYDIEENE